MTRYIHGDVLEKRIASFALHIIPRTSPAGSDVKMSNIFTSPAYTEYPPAKQSPLYQ